MGTKMLKTEVQMSKSNLPLATKRRMATVSVVLLVLSLSCTRTIQGNAPPPATLGVSRPEVLEDVHPRLFFGPGEIPTLQAEAATTHQEIWIPIRDYVDSQLGTSPPSSAPPRPTALRW